AGGYKASYYAEARPHLEKYTQLVPTDAKGWSLLGRDLYYLREKDAAHAALQKAQDMGDKSKDMYTVLFRALVDPKDWPGALAAIQKGEPTTADLSKVAQVYAFMGNVAAADSAYRALVEKDSLSADGKFALLELAKMQFTQKDYPAAVASLTRRIALDPNNDEAYYYRGLCHRVLKELPDALSDFRQAAALAPNKGDRHFWVAVANLESGAADSALVEFKATVALDSTSKNAATAYQRIALEDYLKKKDWKGA